MMGLGDDFPFPGMHSTGSMLIFRGVKFFLGHDDFTLTSDETTPRSSASRFAWRILEALDAVDVEKKS